MNFKLRQIVLAMVSYAIFTTVSAQVNITKILPEYKPEQGTELHIIFDGLPPEPQSYQLDHPKRLVLDFKDSKQLLKQQTIALTGAEASSVTLSEDAQRTRLTINLGQFQSFSRRVEGNRFILKINPVTAVVAAPVVAAKPIVAGVSQIDFQRGELGEAQVVFDLLGTHTPIDIQQQGNQVVVRVLNHPLPAHLLKRFNVQDFATLVSNIEAQNEANHGVIRIQTLKPAEYMAYQADNKLLLSFKDPENKNAKQPLGQVYNGKKISLDFQDIEIRRVLQLLADFTGMNVVTSDSVQGNISLKLKDVPWDQALDLILKTKGLDKRRNGNAIWIAPVAELIKSDEDEAKAMAQSSKSAVLHTEYIQLKYAKAVDIEKLIVQGRNSSSAAEPTKTASGNEVQNDNNGSLLSPRGTLSVDLRTNTLIVTDTAKKIEQIQKMIDQLDVAVKQVMIEARIVRATTDFTKDMGVKWGMISRNNDVLIGGSDTTLWDLRKSNQNVKTIESNEKIQHPQNLNVDLGVSTQGVSRIAFGLINISDFMLDLELSALQADGYGEVISTPKVMTADKQKAKVASGKEVPYQTYGENNSGSRTSFKSALLSLDVTPSITPDGKVQMQLNITSDSPGDTAPNGEIILNKNEINTNVLVSNGETVVLGGIFQQETRNKQTRVPVLGSIPIIGRLFRRDEKSDNKSELLIFVTPRIVNDSLTRNH